MSSELRFDHAIYATGDLDAAEAVVSAALGVSVAAHGVHEGLGTANRILPLGAGYIELLAPDGPPTSLFATALSARLAGAGDGLWAWAVGVADIAPHAARLGEEPIAVRREGFRGWTAGMAAALANLVLPFFVAREPGILDPGAGGPYDEVELELGGDAAALAEWLGADVPGVRVSDGAPGVRAIVAGKRRLPTGV